MDIVTRSAWGARPPRAMTPQAPPRQAFLHHSTDDRAEVINTLAEQKSAARRIQGFHMNTRGWSDIGYHYLVFQPYGGQKRARAFAARNYHYVPAAQEGHNTGTLAICVVGNLEEDQVKRNTRFVIEEILRRHPSVKTLGGHRDVVATTCPGDHLYDAIPRIADVVNLSVYKR